MSLLYLTIPEVLDIHQQLINLFGGSSGVRDMGALEAALFRPQTGYYDDIVQEAAALMESLAMNHPFVDGNKRIAFFVTDTFLRGNGLRIVCDSEIAFQFFMDCFETSTFDFHHLEPWLRKHIVLIAS